ncbi:potassium-transporting ATPase subunit KdpA [Iningainema tapete]|uniref:Potassium-transporting ATPase potassium-binding subunit n=1 Tax=Iningainema tapete BLCC-T55 TaxID=2748662 RepID=A0A8J6XU53_9CYAN|nr:potassium-transporting ATPase subunit KdpA [Iningainema tapete]MBD2777681.1 potassium-transporting ATPase subunit A [Iningainema tapete BLCC-T55]
MLQGFFQIALTLLIVVVLSPIFGNYLARVFLGRKTFLDTAMKPLERVIYLLGGIEPEEEMTGLEYALAVLISNLAMGILVFLLLMFQKWLPLNPTNLGMLTWDTALHTTISFLVNADLQHYTPESTMSYFSQVAALGFLMFIAAATGLAVGIAFIRGLSGRRLGNFYVDLTRTITRVFLPICIIGASVLMSLGVPETLAGPVTVTTLEGATQTIARGPVAHFEIIKMLGENGGAFFAGNSAHPFENPNAASNLIQIVAMLSIPTALIHTYGVFIGNTRQTWLLFWMVFAIFVVLVVVTAVGEYQGNPLVNAVIGEQQNLEGKEVRLGWAQTALFAIATTATMTGAPNGMFDSLMPPGGFCALLNLFVQVIFGAQGTGTASLFIYLLLSVFLTGLLVGRTPEFLGRKIEQWEITLASVILLIHPILILIPTAITLTFPDTLAGISNPGFHGLAQVVYEYASAAANNGSGFEGLADSQPAPTALWWNLSTTVTLFAGRYIPIIAMLLLADSMSHKQSTPATATTLRTDTGLFTGVTAGVILILGVLTFLPVLALGPVAEAFQLAAGR